MSQKYSLTRRASLPGIANYATVDDLPLINITPGRMAWISDIQKLFVFDTGWQQLDTTNLPPLFTDYPVTLDLPVKVRYELDLNQYVEDPDGLNLTYSLETAGITDEDTIVEIDTSQTLNITPGFTPETFTVTVTASDGIETASSTITVTAVNAPFDIVPISTQYPLYNPSVPYTVPLSFTDDDPDDTVTWAIDSTDGIDIANCTINSSNELEVLVDSFYDPFTVTVSATQFDVVKTAEISFVVVATTPAGDLLIDTEFMGTGAARYVWTVPQGVTSISAVAVGSGGAALNQSGAGGVQGGGGGGALAYVTSIAVTPGETLIVGPQQKTSTSSGPMGRGIWRNLSQQPLLWASDGANASASVALTLGGQASDCVGDVAYSGGSAETFSKNTSNFIAGGAGAASYTAAGGNAETRSDGRQPESQRSTAERTGAGPMSNGEGINILNPANPTSGDIGYALQTGPQQQGSLGGGGVGILGTIYSNDEINIYGGGVYGGDDGERNRWKYYRINSQNLYSFDYGYLTFPGNYGGGRGVFSSGPGDAADLGDYGVNKPENGAVRIIYGSGRAYPGSGTQVVPATPIFTSPLRTFTIKPGQTRTFNVTAESLGDDEINYSAQFFTTNNSVSLDDVSVTGNQISVTFPAQADLDDTTFELIVLATDSVTGGIVGQLVTFIPVIPTGQAQWSGSNNSLSTTFVVPPYVYSVSAVAVGGGGMGKYQTGGNLYNRSGGTSRFGTSGVDSFYFFASGGQGGGQGNSVNNGGAGGGGSNLQNGVGGGNGGSGATTDRNAAAGGAGGYAGNGGNGIGGGSTGSKGGGVGLGGQGASGEGGLPGTNDGEGGAAGGGYQNIDGRGGSGGQGRGDFVSSYAYGGGGKSAGGGGGGGGGGLRYRSSIAVTPGQQIAVVAGNRGNYSPYSVTDGGIGGVRVIWGPDRAYPAQNTGTAGISITNTETAFSVGQGGSHTVSLSILNPAGENYTISVLILTDRLTQDSFTIDGDDVTVDLPGDDNTDAHVFTILVETDSGYKDSVDITITPLVPVGQQVFDTPGSYTFTVPEGALSVSVVAVGGGGSGYDGVAQQSFDGESSSFGETSSDYYVKASGGGGGRGNGASGELRESQFGSAITGTENVDYGGGDGGISGDNSGNQPGGGAGGYTGDGGRAGRKYTNSYSTTGQGGGVRLLGQKENGAGGAGSGDTFSEGTPGSGGGGGGGGASSSSAASGFAGSSGNQRSQSYGGGGYSYNTGGGGRGADLRWANNIPVTGGQEIPVVVGAGGDGGARSEIAGADGAVRIIWGSGRSFPSNAEDA